MPTLFCNQKSIKQHDNVLGALSVGSSSPPPCTSDHQWTWSAMSRPVCHHWPCQHRVQPLRGLADAGGGRLAWHICCVSLRPYGHQHPQHAPLATSVHPHHLLSLLPSVLSSSFDPHHSLLHPISSLSVSSFFTSHLRILSWHVRQISTHVSCSTEHTQTIQTEWGERDVKRRDKSIAFYLTLWESVLVVCVCTPLSCVRIERMSPPGHKGSNTLLTIAVWMQENEARYTKAGAAENTIHMESNGEKRQAGFLLWI